MSKVTQITASQGPISRTDLSLATYHFVLHLGPRTDLSLFVKSAPGLKVGQWLHKSVLARTEYGSKVTCITGDIKTKNIFSKVKSHTNHC